MGRRNSRSFLWQRSAPIYFHISDALLVGKTLLSTYTVLDTVLGNGDIARNIINHVKISPLARIFQ